MIQLKYDLNMTTKRQFSGSCPSLEYPRQYISNNNFY